MAKLTLKIILIFLLTALIGWLIYSLNIQTLMADFYFLKTQLIKERSSWPNVLKNYQKVFKYQPDEYFYRQKFSQDLLEFINQYSKPADKEKILTMAIENLKTIPEKEQTFEMKASLANLLTYRVYYSSTSLTTGSQEKNFSLAEQAYQNLIKLSPKMAGIYNDWCQLYFLQENWQRVIEKCQQALNLYPDLPDLNVPYINPLHRDLIIQEMTKVYEKLAETYFKLNDYDQDLLIYQKLVKFWPNNPIYHKKIADIYYLKGNLDLAIKENLRGQVLNPFDPAWPEALSLLYQEKGDTTKAREYQDLADRLK